MRIHTTHTRDAALAHLGRINRWLIAGSVLLTGVFAEVAANAFPGKAIKTAPAPKAGSPATRTSAPRTTTESSGPPLAPPAESPKASGETPSPAERATPKQESAPSQESSAPQQESSPAPSAPSQESAPSREAAPAQESPPAQQSAPAPEASGPVVSGGS